MSCFVRARARRVGVLEDGVLRVGELLVVVEEVLAPQAGDAARVRRRRPGPSRPRRCRGRRRCRCRRSRSRATSARCRAAGSGRYGTSGAGPSQRSKSRCGRRARSASSCRSTAAAGCSTPWRRGPRRSPRRGCARSPRWTHGRAAALRADLEELARAGRPPRPSAGPRGCCGSTASRRRRACRRRGPGSRPGACQWSGVAIKTASTPRSSRTSRMSPTALAADRACSRRAGRRPSAASYRRRRRKPPRRPSARTTAGEVDIVYRSFQLDPSAPTEPTQTVAEHLGAKYGGGPEAGRQMVERTEAVAAEEGLPFRLAEAQRANTADAHRLLHLALAESPEAPGATGGGAAGGVLPARRERRRPRRAPGRRRDRSASTRSRRRRCWPATRTPTRSSTTSARRRRSAPPGCRSSSSTGSTASPAPSRSRSSPRCSIAPGRRRTRARRRRRRRRLRPGRLRGLEDQPSGHADLLEERLVVTDRRPARPRTTPGADQLARLASRGCSSARRA